MSDVIYRQDAITVCNSAIDLWEGQLGVGALVAVRDKISELPSAEPERKKGKWIDTGSGQECSECHEIQYGYDSFRYFCAFCGSDMRDK